MDIGHVGLDVSRSYDIGLVDPDWLRLIVKGHLMVLGLWLDVATRGLSSGPRGCGTLGYLLI